jgi:serine phosphatase RsbU (regulator of sigma subunit)
VKVKGIDHFRESVRLFRRERQIWDTVPLRSQLMLLAMVFCLFSVVGLVGQLESQTASQARMWIAAIYTGILAVGIAWGAIQRKWLWLTFILLLLQVVATPLIFTYVKRHWPSGPAIPDNIKPWLETTSFMTLLSISAAYVLMMSFIHREGERFFRTHTEIELAGEIHKALVTTIHRQNAGYEFYGTSLASGMVGGDLVDVIEGDSHWLAYVADVAGHGVSSGVLMAMIKSATHMSLRFDPQADDLLAGVNEDLCSLKTGNMFATLGFLSWSADRGVVYSLAGHLPILLCRGGEVRLLSTQNLPVGLFPDATFKSTGLEVLPGDLLLILTDGLTEVVNRDGKELGIEAIAQSLSKLRERPVDEIAASIFEQARRHGARTDDQSLLIVRKLE